LPFLVLQHRNTLRFREASQRDLLENGGKNRVTLAVYSNP
jgi:hypothetical protein